MKAEISKTKAATKASKPAAKANTVTKVAPKAAAKPAPKAAVTQAAGKATSKTVAKPAAKTATPAAAKPEAKAPAKAPVKTAAKAPVNTTVKAPAKAPAPVASKTASKAVSAAPAAAPVVPADQQVPVRATRPSSRLAQLTVPSMAQAVASTAAKASYLQTMPTTVQAQPTFAAAKKDPQLANHWKTKSAAELSDAEVIAMPDAEYMNDKQMAFFRLKLVQLKQDIHNSAGETTEHLREDTVVVPDPADRATIEEEHALELRTRDRERKLLKKIEQSIARIDAGDYGYCDETGEPIGVGRLIARPTATLSLEAQQRRELKQKMFGD